jgi:hypothetical protein
MLNKSLEVRLELNALDCVKSQKSGSNNRIFQANVVATETGALLAVVLPSIIDLLHE